MLTRPWVQTSIRWSLPLIAVFVAGPAAGWLIRALRAPDGSSDVSLLLGASPVLGAVAGLVAVGICFVAALPAARMYGPRSGLLTFALALMWPAWMTGRVGWILRADPSAGTLALLGLEGLLVGVVVTGAIIGLGRWSSQRTTPLTSDPVGQFRRAFTTTAGLAGTAAGAAAGLGVAWVVAKEDLRGQALLAAFGAGIASAVAARLVGTALDQEAPIASGFAGMVVAATLAPLVVLLVPGVSDLPAALLTGSVPGAALLQPMDWAAGALLGVPTGLSWVGEFEQPAEPQRA